MPDLARRYQTEKENPDYKLLREQCRVIGVWDDNDYGVSDGGKENRNKVECQRLLLDFLDEPYCAQCLDPLSERINSSNVPLDFTIGDPTVNPSVLEKAMRLCRQVNETSSPARTSSVAAAAMETAFRQRVKYVASVDIAYKKMRELVKTLNPSALVLCAMTHAALAIGASAAVTLSQLS